MIHLLFAHAKWATHNVDNAEKIAVVMPMYNLIGYRNNYWNTLGNIPQFHRHEPSSNNGGSEWY